jgi:diguanylate cyclase (GGDEF)-like protein
VRSREGTGASLILFFEGAGQTEAQKYFARGLGNLLSLTQEKLRLRRRIEAVATRDDLTSAFNFRFLKGALRKELARAQRSHEPLSVIMLDVDRLKDYNDRFGHIMGSGLLQELARVLSAGVRESDWVAKYGGDEFLIILPGTDKASAIRVGERLREDVRGHAFERSTAGEVTASFGVASYPADGCLPRDLIQAADLALYRAKHEGRDRLCVAGGVEREA